jgi:hypothetical protein
VIVRKRLSFHIQTQLNLSLQIIRVIRMFPWLNQKIWTVPLFTHKIRVMLPWNRDQLQKVHIIRRIVERKVRIKRESVTVMYNSAVGIATGYELDDQGAGVRVPVRVKIFTTLCRPDRRSSSQGVKLTTHLQLVTRSRKRGSTHPLPHTSSWRSA